MPLGIFSRENVQGLKFDIYIYIYNVNQPTNQPLFEPVFLKIILTVRSQPSVSDIYMWHTNLPDLDPWFKAKDPTNQTPESPAFLLEGNGFWIFELHHSFSDIWIHQFVGICFFYLVRNILKHHDVFVIMFLKSWFWSILSHMCTPILYWKNIIRNPPNDVNFIPLHGCVYIPSFS